jgi:hypothetical protein
MFHLKKTLLTSSSVHGEVRRLFLHLKPGDVIYLGLIHREFTFFLIAEQILIIIHDIFSVVHVLQSYPHPAQENE